MHQISLLGGLGSSPVLRPDRVYRTGVLSPMDGFSPGQAVMTTADRFTSGPYSGMSLKGLRDAGVPFGQRVKIWWAGVKERAQAGRSLVSPAAAVPTSASQPVVTFEQHQIAPMAAYGQSMSPMGIPHAMVSRAYGQSPALPQYAQNAASQSTMMMFNSRRWPWG